MTKKKLLFLYGASRITALMIPKALEEYYNIDVCFLGPSGSDTSEERFGVSLAKVNEIDPRYLNISQYDEFLGFDPSALASLIQIKQQTGKPVGCTILDIPFHTFEPGRNFNPSLVDRWAIWEQQYYEMDYIVSHKQIPAEYMRKKFKGPILEIWAPLRYCEDTTVYEKKHQVCYCGITRPDKGVHYLMDAVSLSKTSPKLIVMGDGPDLYEYAKYLNISFERIKNCSEDTKFKTYKESKMSIYAGDNPFIAGYSPIESLSVGTPSIIYDWPENRRLFGDHIIYIEPFNSKVFADKIDEMIVQDKVLENMGKRGIEFSKTEWPPERYAKLFYEFRGSA